MPGTPERISSFELAQHSLNHKISKFAQKRYRYLPGVDACEIEQELLEVLWLCVQSYDPDNGAKFNTYFWTCANRRFLDLHKTASRKKRVGDYERISLDEVTDIDWIKMTHEFPAEDEALANINVIEMFRRNR